MIGDLRHIHVIHPLIRFIHSRGKVSLEECIEGAQETTLRAKVPRSRVRECTRLAVELGLAKSSPEGLSLTDRGVRYATAMTTDRRVTPDQAVLLREGLLTGSDSNPTLEALVILLRLIAIDKTSSPEAIADRFTESVGMGWKTATTRIDNTKMGLNFLVEMQLVERNDGQFVITEIGSLILRRMNVREHRPARRRVGFRRPAPHPQPIRNVLKRLQEYQGRTTETIVLAKVRKGHSLLKLSLLYLYQHRCALCETRERKLLRASHIVDWARTTHSRVRLDPRNALLLCHAHDILFDKGLISLAPDLRVIVSPALSLEQSPALRYQVENLTFHRPRKHLPLERYLAAHRNKHGLSVD